MDTPKNVSCDSSPLGLGSTSFIKCDRGGKAGGGEEGGPGLAESRKQEANTIETTGKIRCGGEVGDILRDRTILLPW